MTTSPKEQILGPSFYPHECGSMIECVTKQDALKAMEEHARSRAIDVLRWGASNKLEFLLGVWCDNNTAYDSIEDVINAYELFSHSIDK